jgi:hypothetical protein
MLSIQKIYSVKYHIHFIHSIKDHFDTTCFINTVNKRICLNIFLIIYNEVN